MKKFNAKFKTMMIALAAVLAVGMSFGFAGCGGEKLPTVGILQYAEHESLNNCTNGFIEGLKQEGYEDGTNIKIDLQNAQGKSDANTSISSKFVNNNYALIAAVATPSALAARGASERVGGEVPVVFTAITDPSAVRTDANKYFVTGTSDVMDMANTLELIGQLVPKKSGRDSVKVGVMYTTAEANSKYQINLLKSEAQKKGGFEIADVAFADLSGLNAAINSVINADVDCVLNINDNTVVDNMSAFMGKFAEKKIPVFGSEVTQVERGCVASASLDYFDLGVKTGKMAARILRGEKVEDIDVQKIEDSKKYYCPETAAALGLTIPENFDAETVALKK